MQQLKQLMLFRTQFITSFKKRKQLFSSDPHIQEQMMHDLLLEKKKMHINESQEGKISQSVIAQKIDSPYKLMQLYECSKQVMKDFCEHFLSESDQEDIDRMVTKNRKNRAQKVGNAEEKADNQSMHSATDENKYKEDDQHNFMPGKHLISNMQNKTKLTQKIVKLYHHFFNEQKSSTKAQEIMHVYKKKLCDQAIIVPTIFCWLNDWIAKEFLTFIKNQILQLKNHQKSNLKSKKRNQVIQTTRSQKDTLETKAQLNLKVSGIFQPPMHSSKKKFKRKMNQREVEPDMFFSIDLNHGKSKEDLYEKIDRISMIKKNSINQVNEKSERYEKQKSSRRISLQRAQIYLTIDGNEEKGGKQKLTSKEKRNFSINSYEVSNLLPYKPESIQEPIKKQFFTNEQTEASPINREILIGAFYQKFFSMYKNLDQILPDLDIQYMKQIKRNDRKTQIKKRLKEMSRVLTRNQPLIKSSVEDFQLSFFERKKRIQKQHKIRHKKMNKIGASQSVNDPQTEPTTRYSSLEYSSTQIENKITSEKKIVSSMCMKKQTYQQSNNLRIQDRKREEKQKQTLSLNRPISFQFNLPSLPEKHRNMHSKLKEQSKIVLIQSGRYKLLDTIDSNELIQIRNKKKKISNYSMDLAEFTDKNPLTLIQNQSYSPKKIAQFDKRSVSILEIITKKKKHIPEQFLQSPAPGPSDEAIPTPVRLSRRKTRNPKSIKDDFQAQKQLKEILQTLDNNDDGLISAWQKGEQSPQII